MRLGSAEEAAGKAIGTGALVLGPRVRHVQSVLGAGDAVMAALALGNDRGWDWARTVRTAAAAGAAAVMTAGTEAVSPDAVRELESRVVIGELPPA